VTIRRFDNEIKFDNVTIRRFDNEIKFDNVTIRQGKKIRQ
jgi:hypothetical protein